MVTTDVTTSANEQNPGRRREVEIESFAVTLDTPTPYVRRPLIDTIATRVRAPAGKLCREQSPIGAARAGGGRCAHDRTACTPPAARSWLWPPTESTQTTHLLVPGAYDGYVQ